jgi:hypothetical protein
MTEQKKEIFQIFVWYRDTAVLLDNGRCGLAGQEQAGKKHAAVYGRCSSFIGKSAAN